ncbi:MAG: plasmid partitioning protein RepB, partial [Pseudomonadota bacterium]
TYGQQVPVLLRLDPNNEGRYQVVYGRRRVAALKALKLPVKALLRDLDDRDLILAQGQENSARRDLTFIEKANFARQMRDAGFDRKLICDALSIDKTLISRMLTVADSMGQKLIEAIGPAPGIGRDRWLRLVAALEATGTAPATLLKIVKGSDGPSDARFEAALTGAQTVSPPAPPPQKQSLTGENGAKLGTITRKPRAVALTVTDTEFGDWLTDNMTEVHRIFLQAKGGNGRD